MKNHLIVDENMQLIKIAVEGCCHGELDAIYSTLPLEIELLLICGDFQALRNETDLKTINVPAKYKRLGDFHKYYKGEKKAPILTIFIGGNHECSSYLQELKFGGWIAPNIYYLGEFGCVSYKGILIGGISGIYNRYSFFHSSSERLPYNEKTIRSVYHVKPKSFVKLYLMKNLDIVLSHDWPSGIEHSGDVKSLLKKKKHFRADIESGSLGSPLNRLLLYKLRPRYWFSAHLHVKFEANISHRAENDADNKESERVKLSSTEREVDSDHIEIDMDMDMDMNITPLSSKRPMKDNNHWSKRLRTRSTYFLALDKCLPRRSFIQVIEIETNSDINSTELYYDERAVAANKIIEKYSPVFDKLVIQDLYDPKNLELVQELEKEVNYECKRLSGSLQVPKNFEVVAPTSVEKNIPLQYWDNNQTKEYCMRFGIQAPEI
ncbi:uncharacterized protein PRCAT00002295001 [Priceomyces carsonii]|uniref:uncharacterized protein n=1 Tax=Priceomyces carsonii TaxID=28549 RepID=UPI002ED7FA25|nr:unnamed protein product [Priceomyces carsonii]